MIVADVNLLVYLFIPGEATAHAESVYGHDPDWFAPVLWRSELLNVLNGYIRRRTLSLQAAVDIFTAADEIVTVPADLPPPGEILALSSASGCTVYDCEYVAVARRLGARLVTADRAILRAFPETAVSIQAYGS